MTAPVTFAEARQIVREALGDTFRIDHSGLESETMFRVFVHAPPSLDGDIICGWPAHFVVRHTGEFREEAMIASFEMIENMTPVSDRQPA